MVSMRNKKNYHQISLLSRALKSVEGASINVSTLKGKDLLLKQQSLSL